MSRVSYAFDFAPGLDHRRHAPTDGRAIQVPASRCSRAGRRALRAAPRLIQRCAMSETVNVKVARLLEETASILAEQGANPYRVQAYRAAAQTLLRLEQPVTEILDARGLDGLKE